MFSHLMDLMDTHTELTKKNWRFLNLCSYHLYSTCRNQGRRLFCIEKGETFNANLKSTHSSRAILNGD